MVLKVGGGHNCWLSSNSACADILTTWIRNWAGSVAGGGTQIALQAPNDVNVGSSKTFPDTADAVVRASQHRLAAGAWRGQLRALPFAHGRHAAVAVLRQRRS